MGATHGTVRRLYRHLLVGLVALTVAVAGCAGSAGLGPDDAVAISGRARLDGEHLDAGWLGARVRRDGLVTPCQATLPPVERGRFEIAVFADAGLAGCGVPGAEILLWTHTGEQMLYATTAIPWPSTSTATADVQFSSAAPLGAARPTTDFSGEVRGANGETVPVGSRIEAHIDGTLCGAAAVRPDIFDEGGYILSVVGPDSIAGCRAGATITFRVDGAAAVETAVNAPEESTHLDLTIRP